MSIILTDSFDPHSGYEDAAIARVDRNVGHILIDGVEVATTLQCCHCNAHWVLRRNSGITRGFCRNCMQVTCGQPKCDPCYPFLKKLDDYEASKLDVLR